MMWIGDILRTSWAFFSFASDPYIKPSCWLEIFLWWAPSRHGRPCTAVSDKGVLPQPSNSCQFLAELSRPIFSKTSNIESVMENTTKRQACETNATGAAFWTARFACKCPLQSSTRCTQHENNKLSVQPVACTFESVICSEHIPHAKKLNQSKKFDNRHFHTLGLTKQGAYRC